MTQEYEDTGDKGDVTDEPGANEPEEQDDEEYTGDANPASTEDDDTIIEPARDDDFTPWWQ